jgi:hypothetical protein
MATGLREFVCLLDIALVVRLGMAAFTLQHEEELSLDYLTTNDIRWNEHGVVEEEAGWITLPQDCQDVANTVPFQTVEAPMAHPRNIYSRPSVTFSCTC